MSAGARRGRAGVLLRTAARMEAANWRALGRWVTRRPDVPDGGVAFTHHSPDLPMLVVLTVVSVIEVVGLDLLLRPWPVARWVLLVLGVWGALFCLGMLAALLTRPHVVGPAGLRVRSGSLVDVALPWDAVTGARRVRRPHDGATVACADGVLVVSAGSETTVEVTLRRPVHLEPWGDVTTVRLHADDAAGFVAAVRAGVPSAA